MYKFIFRFKYTCQIISNMPKNKRGGNKAKKGGNKHGFEESNNEIQRPIDSRQKYGIVTKTLGNCRFEVETDGKKCQISLPRKLRGRRGGRIALGTVLLYDSGDLTETEGKGGYAICVYNDRQIKTLRKEGAIPKDTNIESTKIDSLFGGDDLDFDNILDENEVEKIDSSNIKEEIDLDTIDIKTTAFDLDAIGEINVDDI
ncbi:MAG: hypothetical protein CMF62_03165 [Magnetococcales bacterium]|nr:hypothetical protein [Magnetococcales bacterium]